MRSALSKVDGVERVDIDFGAKTARVTCAESCDPEVLISSLEGTRFGASVLVDSE